jgi:hypothetical protein
MRGTAVGLGPEYVVDFEQNPTAAGDAVITEQLRVDGCGEKRSPDRLSGSAARLGQR